MKIKKRKRVNKSNLYIVYVLAISLSILFTIPFTYTVVNWSNSDISRIRQACKYAAKDKLRSIVSYHKKLMVIAPPAMCNRHPDKTMLTRHHTGVFALCGIKYRKFDDFSCCTITSVLYCGDAEDLSEAKELEWRSENIW